MHQIRKQLTEALIMWILYFKVENRLDMDIKNN